MGRSNTLVAMIAGAAIAGGFMYLKKLNQWGTQPAEGSLDEELDKLKKEAPAEDASWKATYTIGGEELSSEEVKERFREESTKAVENFREDARIASEEILIGLKKAIADMKEAVDSARKAAADRRAAAEENTADTPCCADMADGECCCEGMKNVAEDLKNAGEELKDKAEDLKENVMDTLKDLKDKAADAAEKGEEHLGE